MKNVLNVDVKIKHLREISNLNTMHMQKQVHSYAVNADMFSGNVTIKKQKKKNNIFIQINSIFITLFIYINNLKKEDGDIHYLLESDCICSHIPINLFNEPIWLHPHPKTSKLQPTYLHP